MLNLSTELSTVLDDAKQYSNTILSDSKTYTNSQITNNKNYIDTQITSTKTYADSQMAAAVTTANSNTATKITQAKSEISIDTNSKISTSETKLTTAYTNADSALNQKISTLETSTNTKISDTNSKITTLEKTVSDGDKANSTLITNLESSFNTKLNTTNSNITSLQQTVSDNNSSTTNQINELSSKVVSYEPYLTWDFNTQDGFGSQGATISLENGVLTLTSTSTDPQLLKAGLSIKGSDYSIIRFRIKRISGLGTFQGAFYYCTSSHGWSESYRGSFNNPTNNTNWNIIEIDMSGKIDWISNTITSIRIDISNGNGDVWAYDWISIGRTGVGVSSTAIDAIKKALMIIVILSIQK